MFRTGGGDWDPWRSGLGPERGLAREVINARAVIRIRLFDEFDCSGGSEEFMFPSIYEFR